MNQAAHTKTKGAENGPNGLKPCFLNALFGDELQKPVLVAKRVAGCLSMNNRLGKALAALSLKVPGYSCPSVQSRVEDRLGGLREDALIPRKSLVVAVALCPPTGDRRTWAGGFEGGNWK